MMSWKAPPFTAGLLISRTIPSKVFSRLKRFLKLNWAEAELIAIPGVTISLVPVVVCSGRNALFGALLELVVEVVGATPVPVTAVVQPAGRAGGVTPSKFSVNPIIGWPIRMPLMKGVCAPASLFRANETFRVLPQGCAGEIASGIV